LTAKRLFVASEGTARNGDQKTSKGETTMRLQISLTLASLVLYCSVAWSQTFSTKVMGNAGSCTVNKYSLTGKKDIQDQASDSCPLGAASASSSASLDTHLISMTSEQNAAGATAAAYATQTATLKPPKGFKGSSVKFSYGDPYALKLSGLGPPTGLAKACWRIAQLNFTGCVGRVSNGTSSGAVNHAFTLKKSSKGFQLTISKEAYSEVTGHAPPPPVTPAATGGVITTAVPHLILPKGWTCKYDSGNACP
jgi:hypothetical protein